MSEMDRLERDLAAWFAETAAPGTPDWTPELIARVVATHQRPRWSFPGRWLPVLDVNRARLFPVSIPGRWVGLLAVLSIAVIGAVMIAGSRPRLPAPFGLAANGIVAYGSGGDIYTVDPETGSRRAIVTGPTDDHDPRFSLDGTKVAFLRRVRARQRPRHHGGWFPESAHFVDRHVRRGR